MRMILRWVGRKEHEGFCYDCGVDLLLGPKDSPRVRVVGVKHAKGLWIAVVDPLCWRCWRKYQQRDDRRA